MIPNLNRSHIACTEFNGVLTYGNPGSFFGPAVVGFIDLLGFSASVRANWNDAEDSSLGRLLRIKETSERSRDTTIAIAADQGVPPKVKKAFKSRIHTLSDFIVVSNALPDGGRQSDDFSYSLWSLFAAIGFIWECSVKEGYTIRGAIEFGKTYWTPTETIGPAFLDCYEYESKISEWSRVVIGPSLLKILAQMPRNGPESITDFLAASPQDGLIELRPSRLSAPENVAHLERLQAAAGTSRDKYEPLLSHLRGERQLTPIVHGNLEHGSVAIEEKIRQQRQRQEQEIQRRLR